MKNFKLAFLLNLFTRHNDEEVIDSDAYIDLFYDAMREASREDLQEVIYYLINSKVYNTDWEDIIDELDDNGIIEKIEVEDDEDDEPCFATFRELKHYAEMIGRRIFFIKDAQEWEVEDGDIDDYAFIDYSIEYDLEGNEYYLITLYDEEEE